MEPPPLEEPVYRYSTADLLLRGVDERSNGSPTREVSQEVSQAIVE